MVRYNFDYSEYSDILHIHKYGEATKVSAELGDFTLDFGDNDKIIGVEIDHTSEFFANLDIDKESLSKIKGAEFIIDNRNPKCQIIFLKLNLPAGIKSMSLPMLITAQID